MTPLCTFAVERGTNKCENGYTPIYHMLFKDRRYKVRRVLELGIGGPGLSGGASKHGASLRMWEDYFPKAEIFGADIREDLLFNEGRVRTRWADVTKPWSVALAAEIFGGNFDLIVDDADHDPLVQSVVMTKLLPFLSLDGTYIVEDATTDERQDLILEAIPKKWYSYKVWDVAPHLAAILVNPILRR